MSTTRELNQSKDVIWSEESVIVGALIAKGAFGKIFQVTHKTTGLKAAMKEIKKTQVQDKSATEIEMHKKAWSTQDNHIIDLLGSCENAHNRFIFMPCVAQTLNDFTTILDDSRFGDKNEQANYFAQQLAAGILALHNLSIVHRDLKPQNCLVDENYNVKIADFGVSKLYEMNGVDQKFVVPAGTSHYFAPELLDTEYYSGPPADIWALGIIFFQLNIGHLPWPLPLEKYKNFRLMKKKDSSDENYNTMMSKFNETQKDLLLKMLSRNPEKRITSAQLVQHHLLKSRNKSTTNRKRSTVDDEDGFYAPPAKNTKKTHKLSIYTSPITLH